MEQGGRERQRERERVREVEREKAQHHSLFQGSRRTGAQPISATFSPSTFCNERGETGEEDDDDGDVDNDDDDEDDVDNDDEDDVEEEA